MKILFASFQTKCAVVFIFNAAKEVPVLMHGSIYTLVFFGHRACHNETLAFGYIRVYLNV